MARYGLFGPLKGLDAFGRPLEDVRVRTNVGAVITLVAGIMVVLLTLGEVLDYRRVTVQDRLEVDVSRGEKLTVHLDVSFPHVPCYLLSLDVMDVSGEHQDDIQHDITRTRVDSSGRPVSPASGGLRGEANDAAAAKAKDYCGDCYGATPPDGSKCCNTCDQVRAAYQAKGWSFGSPDTIEQCRNEHWVEKITQQNGEGCRVSGMVHVNKVVGNLHLSPGRAFQANSMHMHDLVPYLQGEGKDIHNFGHIIHTLRFASAEDFRNTKARKFSSSSSSADKDEQPLTGDEIVRRQASIRDPLEGEVRTTSKSNYMYQYFIKAVATEYRSLSGRTSRSHQYSVTSSEADLDNTGKGQGGVAQAQVSAGFPGIPGVFFLYEISPLKAVHDERRGSLLALVGNTCALAGGILTIAGLLDRLYNRARTVVHAKQQDRNEPSYAAGSQQPATLGQAGVPYAHASGQPVGPYGGPYAASAYGYPPAAGQTYSSAMSPSGRLI